MYFFFACLLASAMQGFSWAAIRGSRATYEHLCMYVCIVVQINISTSTYGHIPTRPAQRLIRRLGGKGGVGTHVRFLFSSHSTLIPLTFNSCQIQINSQGFTRSHKESQGFTRIHKDSQGFARTHKDSQGFTRINKESQGLTMITKVSQGFTRIHK